MTCETCGQTLTIGDFPFCPHGRGQATVVGDEMDQVIENNGTAEPIRFRSKAVLRAHLDAYNLTPAVRHRPINQGTDYSPHTTDWSRGTDPYTLEAARILVSRPNSRGVVTEPAPTLPIEHTVRVLATGVKGTYTDE